jgi:hypothetical protein
MHLASYKNRRNKVNFNEFIIPHTFILKRHVVVLTKYYLTIKLSIQQLFYISEMSH